MLKKVQSIVKRNKKIYRFVSFREEKRFGKKRNAFISKKVIESQIKDLEETLKFIDKKTELYDKFLSGEVEYYSYLIKNKNGK